MAGPKDEDVWQSYAAKVKRVTATKKRLTQHAPKKTAILTSTPVPEKPPLIVSSQRETQLVSIFDRRMERKLREGSIALKARLDLHGMTQNEAYEALQNFMTAQIRAAHRVVLIITGKGRGGDGVLRSHLQGWLQSLSCAADILAIRTAAVRHGGQGAFYVLLRRRKEKL